MRLCSHATHAQEPLALRPIPDSEAAWTSCASPESYADVTLGATEMQLPPACTCMVALGNALWQLGGGRGEHNDAVRETMEALRRTVIAPQIAIALRRTAARGKHVEGSAQHWRVSHTP